MTQEGTYSLGGPCPRCALGRMGWNPTHDVLVCDRIVCQYPFAGSRDWAVASDLQATAKRRKEN